MPYTKGDLEIFENQHIHIFSDDADCGYYIGSVEQAEQLIADLEEMVKEKRNG